MGITIHYRGTLAELDRLEDFEDRTIDLVLALGGNVKLWRSTGDIFPERVVRGLIADIAPGQERISLLVSPEGWLTSIWEIEAAELGQIVEPSWCFVKTQFGPLEGHVAIVELFSCLKQEFFPDLEVSDESGYWEYRDVGILKQKLDFLGRAIDSLGAALQADTLSREAAEDPEIVAARVERIARIVRQTMLRPAEHPQVNFPDEGQDWSGKQPLDEAIWDEAFRENLRRQERIVRIFEEHSARGVSPKVALERAMEDVVGPMPTANVEDSLDDTEGELIGIYTNDDDESWRSSLAKEDIIDTEFTSRQRHPLIDRATKFLHSLDSIGQAPGEKSSRVDVLFRGASEICGGLAQALSRTDDWETDRDRAGWSLVQLRRALRGAAFARGALIQSGNTKVISAEDCERWKTEIEAIESEIVDRIKEIRAK